MASKNVFTLHSFWSYFRFSKCRLVVELHTGQGFGSISLMKSPTAIYVLCTEDLWCTFHYLFYCTCLVQIIVFKTIVRCASSMHTFKCVCQDNRHSVQFCTSSHYYIH